MFERYPGRSSLGRLFFAFPRLAGSSFAVAACGAGAAVTSEGIFCFVRADSAMTAWFSGLLALAAGGLLLAGFLTPIAAAIIGAGAVAVGLSLLPPASPNFFDSRSSARICGHHAGRHRRPRTGRLLVDARVFGRREIIIPPHRD